MRGNPINSSPYFPFAPSGSLEGFVYWRRGREEGDPRGPETVQSTSFWVKKYHLRLVLYIFLLHAGDWHQGFHRVRRHWRTVLFLHKNANGLSSKPPRGLTALSQSLIEISALVEEFCLDLFPDRNPWSQFKGRKTIGATFRRSEVGFYTDKNTWIKRIDSCLVHYATRVAKQRSRRSEKRYINDYFVKCCNADGYAFTKKVYNTIVCNNITMRVSDQHQL